MTKQTANLQNLHVSYTFPAAATEATQRESLLGLRAVGYSLSWWDAKGRGRSTRQGVTPQPQSGSREVVNAGPRLAFSSLFSMCPSSQA